MAPSSGLRGCKAIKTRSRSKAGIPYSMRLHCPYFAHQQLDLAHYASVPGLALPVAKPRWAPAPLEIATVTNGGWDDTTEIPLDEDPEEQSLLQPSPAVLHEKQRPFKEPNPYKRVRVTGGRPAVAKKVTADLDSEDELIVRMKNAKYLEKDIAQRLVDEGRIHYNPKTIGTRWARLRKVLAQRNDELLDAEATDWHDGDDEVLQQAYDKAHEITEKAKADAEARKWRIVADQLKQMKPVTNFSQYACRDRYEALQAGTAKATPESIANPDEEVSERIRSRREREQRINSDMSLLDVNQTHRDNLQGNGWTSKGRTYV